MRSSSSQPTLRELLRPIAAHKWLLLSIIVLAVAASIAYSKTRNPVYRAQASIAYQDPSQNLGLVGLAAPPVQTSVEIAAAGAQTLLQPAVAEKVKHDVHSKQSVDALLGAVTATVQPSSNLVVLQASAPTASQAQDLANAFAKRGAEATNKQTRDKYHAAYEAALGRVGKHGGPKLGPAAKALEDGQIARLQVLSTIASSARVVLPASLPSGPSSPRPVRDGLLAAGLGLMLGLLAVYLRDSFDRRLRTVSDVEEQIPLPMIGHVRTEVLGRSPRVASNGHKNAAKPVAAVDWELFRILRRNLDFLQPDQGIRSIAVTSSLPEEGKSTVAAFLAFTSATAGKRTLLVEADLRRPVLAARLGIKPSPGVSDLVVGEAKLSDVVQVIRFADPASTNGSEPSNGHVPDQAPGALTHSGHELACITAGTKAPDPVEILRSHAMSEMLSKVRGDYDLVILDTPPMLSVVDALELLPNVDGAVVCVRVYRTTRQQASAGRAALKRLPEKPTALVVTGTRRAAEAEYGYYGYYA